MRWSTTTMNIELGEDGIAVITPAPYFKGPETEVHARENTALFTEELVSRLKGILAYMPPHYINASATSYYKKHAPEVPLALVADSFFKKAVGNFLMSLARTRRPVKLFTSGEEASQWLHHQIKASVAS